MTRERWGAVARVTGGVAWIVFLVLVHVATLGYFVPWWVAVRRKVPDWGAVAVIDVFLGWTLVGWVVALALACRSKRSLSAQGHAG